MLKRHDEILTSKFDELCANGSVYITWEELYWWFGQTKITKKVWRQLWEKWIEVADTTGTISELDSSVPAYKKWAAANVVQLQELTGGFLFIQKNKISEETLEKKQFGSE